MRALLQRVDHASVTVDGQTVGSCGHGLLVLLGVGVGDVAEEAGDKTKGTGGGDADGGARVPDALLAKLWHKIRDLRIFDDEAGKTNLSLVDVGGEVLVVSQFTLYANARRGRRPSFTDAAAPAAARDAYERFCALAEEDLGAGHVGRGVFGAMMSVELVNDGPFTIWLDTDEL